MDTILVLQGGGSLGAYECGVYKALAPWLRKSGHALSVVAGTSIGAINAAIIAVRYGDRDQGVMALEDFWHLVANNSLIFPPFVQSADWNAVWTTLLFGNPRLFVPTVPFWMFVPPVAWDRLTSFYDTGPLENTLGNIFDKFGPNQTEPRLIVTAVNLDRIEPVAFDSLDTAITPRHILASCSLPPTFPATQLDGHRYWDGGLWSNTPLRDALNCLQSKKTPAQPKGLSNCLVFIVDLFTRQMDNPVVLERNWDVWSLRDRVLFQDKAEYDECSANWVSQHIQFVENLRQRIRALPAEERSKINDLEMFVESSAATLEKQGRLQLTIRRVARSSGSHEISREIDFSPEKTKSLINQGYEDTLKELQRR